MIVLGIGLLIIGLTLIAGFFLIGSSDSIIKAGDLESVYSVIDKIETMSNEKQQELRELIYNNGVFKQLEEKLNDRNYQVRAETALRIGKIGGKKAAKLLFKVLADKNEDVRYSAAQAIKAVNDYDIIPELVTALKNPEKWLPARIAEILVYFGQKSLPALEKALDDDDPIVRAYVVEIISEIGSETGNNEIIQSLSKALEDENSKVRLQAIKALSKIHSPGVYKTLEGMLNDPDSKVQVQVIRSLGKLKDTKTLSLIEQKLLSNDTLIRNAAFDILRYFGDEGMQIIKKIAGDTGHPLAQTANEFLKSKGLQSA